MVAGVTNLRDTERAISPRLHPPRMVDLSAATAFKKAAEVILQPLTATGVDEVSRLLERPVQLLYPNGRGWLASRLRDIVRGKALGIVAWQAESAIGVAILTPKSADRMKLSTVFVAEQARNWGVGSALVHEAVLRADAAGVTELWVTVAHHIAPQLTRLLHTAGFTETAFLCNRYGSGRHEIVYTRVW